MMTRIALTLFVFALSAFAASPSAFATCSEMCTFTIRDGNCNAVSQPSAEDFNVTGSCEVTCCAPPMQGSSQGSCSTSTAALNPLSLTVTKASSTAETVEGTFEMGGMCEEQELWHFTGPLVSKLTYHLRHVDGFSSQSFTVASPEDAGGEGAGCSTVTPRGAPGWPLGAGLLVLGLVFGWRRCQR